MKTIGAQQLTQWVYLMRYVVMTHGLFEVGDAYDKNEFRITKDVTQNETHHYPEPILS